ncbi:MULTISPECIES: P-loop NTPase fold protein [unclassified Arenibacter]|uniref:KAP family P-loop NTPase fold protein n=1 Tax=unclassified Arenibacter TaxID=2615047 RepID=UPI000E3529B7|nr:MULTISPECIES: P-loop NTPase fold protein [unclassified Arenibacter]MCM4162993.1 hypothetical protein [Arenibacter sp. A80]RFT57032.1 hypothetical protein D0S24_05240 [Arenibacter sp. P308M17]
MKNFIGNSNITYELLVSQSPVNHDVAIVSTNSHGTPGDLNKIVLIQCGYKMSALKDVNLERGYGVLSEKGLIPILLIVTVGNSHSSTLLLENLRNGLRNNISLLTNKKIWIPLMGTGQGGLTNHNSFNLTIAAIHQNVKYVTNAEFIIALPNEKTAKELEAQINLPHIQAAIDNMAGFETYNNEVQIDKNGTFFYGQEVGEEIKNYDIIFLPKSTIPTIGNNGISAHIVNLLGIEKNSLKFSKANLEKYKFAWETIKVDERIIHLCFIVTWDKNNKPVPFEINFAHSIENFRKSEAYLSSIYNPLNIFIPFLGTGQAGMDIRDSLTNLMPGLKRISSILQPKKIRLNFPIKLKKDEINSLTNIILSELQLEKYKIPDNTLEDDNVDQIEIQNGKDRIPFHLDNIETVDKLNREPVAKSLARLINKEIFANISLQHSFMIHLQGEWGSGKSTFLNLIKNHLDVDNNNWVVVNFDAWQNQHISPPWWSFIDQVYRQAKEQFEWTESPSLWLKESARRIIWYSGWHKIMALVISVIFGILLISYGGAMIKVLAELPSAENIDNSTTGLTLDVFAKLIVSIGSILGLVYSLSKFLSTPFLMKSSGEAKSFLLRAADPMNSIKKHYNKLIEDINGEGYNVAIFIDDIDRCDRNYTISLLEGIQTLFKEKKVLYVVAGDKNWLSTCFENNYKEFVDKINRRKEKLGDSFLEKVFQLSIRMPNVSTKAKERYWHHILGLGELSLDSQSKVKLSEELRDELKQKVINSYSTIYDSNPKMFAELETEYQLSEEDFSDIAIEALDENKADIRHLFSGHFNLINPNPRAVKRLANNYTMYRNTLIAERKYFNPNKLFRWLIIDDLYPALSKKISKLNNIEDINAQIDKMLLDSEELSKLNRLLFDKENLHGGILEVEDIKDIMGI